MNRKRRRRRRFALLVLLAMILAAALGIQFRIRPMLRTIAETQVVNAASSALAGAVNRQMAEGTADYGGLISFEKDETGQITAMRTDTGQIARLKAEVFAALDDLVSEVEIRDLGVPLGSLFLPSFFAGRGLRLPVKVVTTATRSSAATCATSSANGLMSMMLTPKGFFVRDLAIRICSRT